MARYVMIFLDIVLLSMAVMIYPVKGIDRLTSVTWSYTYLSGDAFSVRETLEGGFIVAGHGVGGALLLKLNPAGNAEWSRAFLPEGYADATALAVRQTSDRGFVLAGSALSINYATRSDAWLLKLDHRGQVQWSKTYGGRETDSFFTVEQTSDGGYVVAGNIAFLTNRISNGWIMRLDALGNVVWQEAFVGQDVSTIDSTLDGGLIVAGTVDLAGKAAPWLFKLDSGGRLVWQRAYDPTLPEVPLQAYYAQAYLVWQALDGGYVMVGEARSRDYPSGNFVSSITFILKLDIEGNVEWQKSYRGEGEFTHPYSVQESFDGGLILAGRSVSPFLLKMDPKGNIVWQNVYGVPNDFFYDARSTRDGGLVVVGSSFLSPNPVWVLKLTGDGTLKGCRFGITAQATSANLGAIVVDTTVTETSTDVVVISQSSGVKVPQPARVTTCQAH